MRSLFSFFFFKFFLWMCILEYPSLCQLFSSYKKFIPFFKYHILQKRRELAINYQMHPNFFKFLSHILIINANFISPKITQRLFIRNEKENLLKCRSEAPYSIHLPNIFSHHLKCKNVV